MKMSKLFKICVIFLIFLGFSFSNLHNFTAEVYSISNFARGAGTENDPYIIETEEQLRNVANNRSNCFMLANDINLTSDWSPIGTSYNYEFTGIFDGNGYNITNVNVPFEGRPVYAGLFGILKNSTIKNLGVYTKNDGVIAATEYAGGLVAYNNGGTITNCFTISCVKGQFRSNSYYEQSTVGTLVGYNTGTITNCYGVGSVVSTHVKGGLVGKNYGVVSNSYYNADTTLCNDTGKGIPKTTEEMKNITTYSEWDFYNTWYMGKNNYPFLIRQNYALVSDTDVLGESSTNTEFRFKTDNNVSSVCVYIRYNSDCLQINSVLPTDFKYVSVSSITNDISNPNYKTAKVIAQYDMDLYTSKNFAYTPFKIIFNIFETSNIENTTIEILDSSYIIDDIGNKILFNNIINSTINVFPNARIDGAGSISGRSSVKYSLEFLTDIEITRTIEWSLDNTNIATINQEGVLTPINNGIVNLVAKIQDSSLCLVKQVEITNIKSSLDYLKSDIGVWNNMYSQDVYSYTLYVPITTTVVAITPVFNNGLLQNNNYGICFKDQPIDIVIDKDNTYLEFEFNQTGLENAIYSINIIKSDYLNMFDNNKIVLNECYFSDSENIYSTIPKNTSGCKVIIGATNITDNDINIDYYVAFYKKNILKKIVKNDLKIEKKANEYSETEMLLCEDFDKIVICLWDKNIQPYAKSLTI